jgi:thiol-disulfide isomerase/thioredoxin
MLRLLLLAMVSFSLTFVAAPAVVQAGDKKDEKKDEKKDGKFGIGSPAPNFSNLPNATEPGKTMSLSDLKDREILVICITCNHCPVAVMYEDRLIEFAKKYNVTDPNSKVGFVAINVNNLEQDKLPKMVERAKEKGFNFPYLYDETQAIGRALKATVTPEFYVFDKNRKLIYRGAMDDNNRAAEAKTNYLVAAVEAGLKGTAPATAETKARGCSVKYENK